RSQAQKIADRRRNVEPCTLVQVRLWPVVAEDVFPMIRAERPAVAPLRVANAAAFADGHPTVPANALPIALKGLRKPRNDLPRLGFEVAQTNIIVRQGHVTRGLFRD